MLLSQYFPFLHVCDFFLTNEKNHHTLPTGKGCVYITSSYISHCYSVRFCVILWHMCCV
jgi:hypothetical protein